MTKGCCGTTWVSWKLRYFRKLLIKPRFDSSEETWWRGYGPQSKNVAKTLMNLRHFGSGGRRTRGQKKDKCWKLLTHFVLISEINLEKKEMPSQWGLIDNIYMTTVFLQIMILVRLDEFGSCGYNSWWHWWTTSADLTFKTLRLSLSLAETQFPNWTQLPMKSGGEPHPTFRKDISQPCAFVTLLPLQGNDECCETASTNSYIPPQPAPPQTALLHSVFSRTPQWLQWGFSLKK